MFLIVGQLDTHILYYDKISSCMEKPYIGSSYMVHDDADDDGETSLEILKGCLKILTTLMNQRKYQWTVPLANLETVVVTCFVVPTLLGKHALTES